MICSRNPPFSLPTGSRIRLGAPLRSNIGGNSSTRLAQFFHHVRDDPDRSFGIGIRVEVAKRKTQAAPRPALAPINCLSHLRSKLAANREIAVKFRQKRQHFRNHGRVALCSRIIIEVDILVVRDHHVVKRIAFDLNSFLFCGETFQIANRLFPARWKLVTILFKLPA
jgi:hypothetical protein